MSRLISNKLGKVEVRVLLFCFISFLVVSLGLNLVNRNSIEHTARAQSGDAYVETDQVDYSAGDMAEIFGSGWEPGESVMLEITGDPAIDSECPPDTLNVIADSEGNISNQYMIPGHGFDQTFTLVATGLESGLSSQAVFTNNLNSAAPPAPEIEDSVLATVMTDKDDYFPGEVVQITGSGWEPGETVELYLVGEPLTHDPETLYAVADESGKIFAQYVVQLYDFGRVFTLTATGLTSGLMAETTFTDGNSSFNDSFSIVPTPVTVGANLNWSVTSITCGTPANQCPGGTLGVNVPDSYTFNVVQRSGNNCTGGAGTTRVANATPTSGAANGSFTAPTTAGNYSYRLEHNAQCIGNPAQNCKDGVTWNAANSNCVTISVQAAADTTPPTITCPPNITAEADGPGGKNVNYTVPTATDNTDPNPTESCSPTPNSLFPLGMTTVTCTATDAAGNSAQCTFDVTVEDTTPPDITCPSPVTLEGNTTGGYQGTAYTVPTATDIVDPNPTESCSPAPGDSFSLGTTPVTCTATDAAGNSAQCTFDVTVEDTTPPDITCPSPVTLEGNTTGGFQGAAYTVPTATDIVDPNPTESCSPAPGALFPLGTTSVTCTATDASANSASCSFNVTVQDTTPPDITCPADINGTVGQVVNLGSPTVSDIVDPNPMVDDNAPDNFPPGMTTVMWTATDASGNSASCNQKVTLTYIFLGFFPPVDNLPVVNLAKGGQGIPFKWVIKDANGNYISDLSTVVSYGYGSVACMNGTTDAIESYETAGNSGLRWDPVEMQFIFTSKTLKGWAGYCKTFTLNLDDGTMHKANFKFK